MFSKIRHLSMFPDKSKNLLNDHVVFIL